MFCIFQNAVLPLSLMVVLQICRFSYNKYSMKDKQSQYQSRKILTTAPSPHSLITQASKNTAENINLENYGQAELKNPVHIHSCVGVRNKRQKVLRVPPLQLGDEMNQLKCRSYFYFSNVLRGDAVIDMMDSSVPKLKLVGRKAEFEKINSTLSQVSPMRQEIIKYLFGRFHSWVGQLEDHDIIEIYRNLLRERASFQQRQYKYKCLSEVAQQPINKSLVMPRPPLPNSYLMVSPIIQINSDAEQDLPYQSLIDQQEEEQEPQKVRQDHVHKGFINQQAELERLFTFVQESVEVKNVRTTKNQQIWQQMVKKEKQAAPRKRVHIQQREQNGGQKSNPLNADPS